MGEDDFEEELRKNLSKEIKENFSDEISGDFSDEDDEKRSITGFLIDTRMIMI